MADAPVVHIGEHSPEWVAFKLMERIAAAEKVSLFASPPGTRPATREWIIRTYIQCIDATRGALSDGKDLDGTKWLK